MSHPAADPEYWAKRWEEGNIGWHKPVINQWLSSNLKILTGSREDVKIFVPLCGKTLALKWLLDQGHRVVGVEISCNAIEEFFLESDLNYICETSEACDGVLYRSEDNRVKLYSCDLFKFSSDIEGTFDAIWDRGSMVAIVPEQRERYCALMQSLMASDCTYILERLNYDIPGKTGPPHCIPWESIEGGYGDKCNIESIEKKDSPVDAEKFKAVFFELEYVKITPK